MMGMIFHVPLIRGNADSSATELLKESEHQIGA